VQSALDKYGSELNVSDLSEDREAALLAVADPTFRTHRGVDLSTPGAGMTTITQGLVKLLYFPEGFRPGIAKIRQTLIAQYALDELISKDKQLRLFLNISYFGRENGRSVHGFADASRTYFGKEFHAISEMEFLSLVAMLIGPNNLKPDSRANHERVERIKSYLSGEYRPDGLLDVNYTGEPITSDFRAHILIALLRIITDSDPE
jgi:membrane peptidoglycan carboxypeptidase